MAASEGEAAPEGEQPEAPKAEEPSKPEEPGKPEGESNKAEEGKQEESQQAAEEEPPPKKRNRYDEPCWLGEAWARDDGLVLNLPVFARCCAQFKRMLLRAIRWYEYEGAGRETWYDADNDAICTLETLPPDRLPPLLSKTIGQALDPFEYACRGGDYDQRLILVLSGSLQKLVGDAPAGGKCIVRELQRGDCEGITEFLGVGSEQRTCALRAGPNGAHVRFVTREAVTSLLAEKVPGPDGELAPKYPAECEYFAELSLDRIDSLHHKHSKQLLKWSCGGGETLDFLSMPGQNLFKIDNALGTSVSGPLPEGIEERYYLDGQAVLLPRVQGDCCIMIMRGQLEALVPDGCGGQCLLRDHLADPGTAGESWLGDGRCRTAAQQVRNLSPPDSRRLSFASVLSPFDATTNMPSSPTKRRGAKKTLPENEVVMVALVPPDKLKRAVRKLTLAAEKGELDLSGQKTSDWRWQKDDPEAMKAIDILQSFNLLSPAGEAKAEEVRLHQHPPEAPPPPKPQSILSSGTVIGQTALMGVPVVFAGVVRAKGPCLIAVLHRHVLLEAIAGQPEIEMFLPKGVPSKEWVHLLKKPHRASEAEAERPSNSGPSTGPPPHKTKEKKEEPKAGSYAAWKANKGPYRGMAGADAFEHVLLNAVRNYALTWGFIHDAPDRLLEAFVRQFEPRWMLPNETVIVDEEPDADFLFVVIHGSFVVTLEGAEIDFIGQGDVQGASQLLKLSDWTRTVTVDPNHKGEAMIQVLPRSKVVEVLAGHPVPKARMREVEEQLRDAKQADWRLLQYIPAFGSATSRPFLSRVHKDADIRLFCPGDILAEAGDQAASMIVVLAGTLRSEQPQTLFYVELKRGDWCFQNNILGVESTRAHDVVAVTHVMVLFLYRHTLLNAIMAHPEAREAVLENESWRADAACPQLGQLHIFESVPCPVLSRLEKEAAPRYFKAGSIILAAGAQVEDDALLLIMRGQARISILGIHTRTLGVGDTIGVHRFLDLPAPASQAEIVAVESCDILALHPTSLAEALEDDRYEDDLAPFKNAKRVLGGGDILDAFGFPIGGSAKLVPDCIEKSEVFSVCSQQFVNQIPQLVEEMAFWPGEKIYSQGDDGTFMYFVQSGRVRLEVLGRKEHEIVDAGATVGDMACLGQVASHVETAVAETHCWVRVLHRRLLLRALSSFPEEERRLTGSAGGGGAGLFDE